MDRIDQPSIPAMSPADVAAHTAASHIRKADTEHRDDLPGLPPLPRRILTAGRIRRRAGRTTTIAHTSAGVTVFMTLVGAR